MRVSRDKRGYEQISLLHVSGRRGTSAKPQVLYVFRTPPGVKVGREPFDDAVRRALEEQNPGVVFDWKKLSNIPVPAPDVEYWRERRRADKAARQARRAEDQESTSGEERRAREPSSDDDLDVAPELEAPADQSTSDSESYVDQAIEPAEGGEPLGLEKPESLDGEVPSISSSEPQNTQGVTPNEPPAGHRRRRRRGGRRRRRGRGPESAASPEASSSTGAAGEPPAAPDAAAEPSKLPRDTSKEA